MQFTDRQDAGKKKAAIQWVKNQQARFIIVAVPVAPAETLSEIQNLADEVTALFVPSLFYAVGQFQGVPARKI